MNINRRTVPMLCVFMLVLSSLACNFPGSTPEPPASQQPPDTPAEAEEDPSNGEQAPAVTEENDGSPGISAPESSWLPDGTIALIRSGLWGTAQLKAVNAAGAVTDLGVTLHGASSISRSGRWVATADSPTPASSMLIRNLEDGTVHTIPVTTDWTVYGSAFDNAEGRLAFMELGASGGTYMWAVVVVDLSDGSTTRFDTSFEIGVKPEILPGRPMGWDVSDTQLLLDTFMPDTEGNWAGIWGVALPPAAASAALDTLPAVEYLAMGDYLSTPVLSRDGSQILYLNRDYSYAPTDYEVMAFDLVVNELWTMDLASSMKTILVDATDGSALFREAAWSMDGSRIMFGQGTFAGGANFDSGAWKTHSGGVETVVGPAAIPSGGSMQMVKWCRPNTGLASARTSSGDIELQVLDLSAGAASTVVETEQTITILGCVP